MVSVRIFRMGRLRRRMIRSDATSDELWAALPALSGEDLSLLLDHPHVDEKHVLKLLERQDLPGEFLLGITKTTWIRSPRVQFYLVNNPSTPLAHAMNFVKFLFWRDLNLVTMNFRLSTEVRHMAESVLFQRLPALAVGEKVLLARVAGGQTLKALRLEKEARITAALLENPRLVEEDALFIINQSRTPGPVLEAIARDPKWSTRKEVRVALLRNGSTPLSAVIPFITQLNAQDLKSLLHDPKVPAAVRRMIQTRLGGER